MTAQTIYSTLEAWYPRSYYIFENITTGKLYVGHQRRDKKKKDCKNRRTTSIIVTCNPEKYGWLSRVDREMKKEWGVTWSHTQIRRFVEKEGIETYKRKG